MALTRTVTFSIINSRIGRKRVGSGSIVIRIEHKRCAPRCGAAYRVRPRLYRRRCRTNAARITSMAIVIAAAVLFVNLRFAVFFAFIIIFSPFFFGLNALRLPAGFSGVQPAHRNRLPFSIFQSNTSIFYI